MLARRADAAGSVKLSMKVGEDGTVQSVAVTPTGILDEQLVTCVRQTAMSAQFDRPTGGPVIIAVPITFTPKDAKPSTPVCQPTRATAPAAPR
jgi:TonB family protein